MSELPSGKSWIYICACVFCFWAQAQNITVNQNLSPQELVNDVLVNSNCASVTNVQVVSGNFQDGSLSYGFFDRNGSDFPFENGIVLSTGRALSAPGPNDTDLSETAAGWPGDADLEQALGVRNTTNATILEFDFTPVANRISFDYLFASEEYNSPRPCDFSDGFAFLLKRVGVDEPFQNLAVVPNTNTPVKVTTVHPTFSGPFGCPAENEEFFGRLNGSVSPINFNGQTAVLTASADVIPNVTYRIKLVIADETNALFDSTIFIAGGSFSIQTDLGPDRTLQNGNALCVGDSLVLNADIGVPGSVFQWFRDGVLLPGETNATLSLSQEGLYAVEVDAGGGCVSLGEVLIEFAPPPTVFNTVLQQCDIDSDGLSGFNLNRSIEDITAGDQSLTVIGYFTSQTDAESNQNPIGNPSQFFNTQPNQVVYARVESVFGCVSVAEIVLQTAFSAIPPQTLEACSTSSFAEFNLSLANPSLLQGLPPGLVVNYYRNENDALFEQNALPTFYTNQTPGMQTIYARINNGTDCLGITLVDLIVRPVPQLSGDESLIICLNSSNPLLLTPGVNPADFSAFTYLWSTGETTPTVQVSSPGIFTVTVTNNFGCSAVKTITLTASDAATIEEVLVEDLTGPNRIEIVVSGAGDYEFALDFAQGPYQDSAVFNDVLSGFHTVFVRDKNGCGITSAEVAVLGIPKFFTPNGDGFNDTWQLRGLPPELVPGTKIYIFDRYGKLLKDLAPNGPGWDGRYRNQLMPSTDYWYRIVTADGRTARGHFSLKR